MPAGTYIVLLRASEGERSRKVIGAWPGLILLLGVASWMLVAGLREESTAGG